MAQDNKIYLPHVLNGISKKLHALFLQKLILYDSQILQSRHIRHYDFECEGLFSLISFLDRKTNKNQALVFQKLKDYRPDLSGKGQIITQEEERQQPKKGYLKSLETMATPRTKFFTRANTSIQESDNSFIFSPNLKRKPKTACKTEYFGSSIHVGDQRSDILEKLLTKVKKINHDTYQESLQHAKSSYFNMTLGKQSLQTFQNNSHCELPSHSYKKESKNMKRKKILQSFQRIEQKIEEEPRVVFVSYVTPRAKRQANRLMASRAAYSVYEPVNFYETSKEAIYASRTQKNEPFNERGGGSGLSSSQSVTHINYARQVYL